MPFKIFYSWQSDTQAKGGRNLVEAALKQAIDQVKADGEYEEAKRPEILLDKDTKDVAGSPPIVDTILKKISQSAIFVPDMTFVGTRPNGGKVPNPNVLIEYGYALRSLTHFRILPVMNTAHGKPTAESLPFDLRHHRHPIQYECADDAPPEVRKATTTELAKTLSKAIQAVLESPEFKEAMKPPVPIEPHPQDIRLLEEIRGVFTRPLQGFLIHHNFGDSFPRARLVPLDDWSYDWHGPNRVFEDPALEQGAGNLLIATRSLLNLIDARTYPARTNPDMQTVKTDMDLRDGLSEKTREVIKQMNAAAKGIMDRLHEFEAEARKRVRL